jgi:hypothetical protein
MQKEPRQMRKKEKQSLRTILFLLFVLIIVVVFFLLYGIQMLINFSLYLEGNKSNSAASASNSNSYIAPPVINPMNSATNSAQVIVTGYTVSDYTVKLFVNDHLAGSQPVAGDKSFSFHNIQLQQGENDLKAQSVTSDGKVSDFSEITKITFSNKAPTLTVTSPNDGQTFSGSDNPIKIIGKADAGSHVQINDYWAIVDDQGNFSYILPLQKGDNHLHIVASDDAGNQATKDLKVTLNQ